MPFTFKPGRPLQPCRPYTPDEVAKLVTTTLGTSSPSAASAAAAQPHAVFVSGLPGAGKTALFRSLLASGRLPDLDYAVVDADDLRRFHHQFVEQAAPASSNERFEDGVAWFMEGSQFEDAVFRRPEGLMQTIFANKCSFVQPVTINSESKVGWIKFVIEQGYIAHFVLVHVPLGVSITRATSRAYRTGRWCPPSFVEASLAGIRSWSAQAWRLCEGSGGTAVLIDNTREVPTRGDGTVQARTSLSDFTLTLADEYGLHAELLSHKRVEAFAQMQLTRVVALLTARSEDETDAGTQVFDGVSFSLAGGMFKSLLLGGDSSPRDIDVWPLTESDERALFDRLSLVCASSVSGPWNHKFTIPASALVLEVVRGKYRDLRSTVARFDIALAAIGVEVVSGVVVAGSAFVHPNAVASIQQAVLFLTDGFPNKSFLLATAERLLRYAHELSWPRPMSQLQALQAVFLSECETGPDRRQELVSNYKATSLFEGWRAEVLHCFEISEDEYAACP